jgi:hypothetical protein
MTNRDDPFRWHRDLRLMLDPLGPLRQQMRAMEMWRSPMAHLATADVARQQAQISVLADPLTSWRVSSESLRGLQAQKAALDALDPVRQYERIAEALDPLKGYRQVMETLSRVQFYDLVAALPAQLVADDIVTDLDLAFADAPEADDQTSLVDWFSGLSTRQQLAVLGPFLGLLWALVYLGAVVDNVEVPEELTASVAVVLATIGVLVAVMSVRSENGT